MEKRDYRIKKHMGFGLSIDEYSSGKFLCQVAYWFKSGAEAKKRLAEIIAEDEAAAVRK